MLYIIHNSHENEKPQAQQHPTCTLCYNSYVEIIMHGFPITSEVSRPQDSQQAPRREVLTSLTDEFPEIVTGLQSLLGEMPEDE